MLYKMVKSKNCLNLILLLTTLVIISGCHSGYEEKDGQVYHKWIHGGNWTKEYSLMEKADAETFRTIKHDLNIDLGKDKNYVFKDASILENADPNSFEQVAEYYWKDKNYVFLLQFGETNCIIKNAEPKSFKIISEYLWSRDNEHVFYKFDLLDNVKAKDFQAINEDWGKTKLHYYYHNLRIDSLDYETAEIVNTYFMDESPKQSNYIKDKDNVFFQNLLVKDANPKTFVADGVGTFGHDDKYMFDWEKNEGIITEQYRKTYIDKK